MRRTPSTYLSQLGKGAQKETLAEKTKQNINNLTFQAKDIIEKVSQRFYVIVFTAFFLYFIYNLLLVDEDDRLSDEYTFWGAFVSAIFAFIASLSLN